MMGGVWGRPSLGLDIVTFFYVLHCFNVIFRFSDISRSTRAILKFQNLRSLLKNAQNI